MLDLLKKYESQGFALLFFPCNQFNGQEPGSAEDIRAFYVEKKGLPPASLMERADVNGADTQPAFKFFRSAQLSNQNGKKNAIEWNFAKFVVGRDGQVIKRYGPAVGPESLDEKIAGWLAA